MLENEQLEKVLVVTLLWLMELSVYSDELKWILLAYEINEN